MGRIIYIRNPSSGSNFRTLGGGGGIPGNGPVRPGTPIHPTSNPYKPRKPKTVTFSDWGTGATGPTGPNWQPSGKSQPPIQRMGNPSSVVNYSKKKKGTLWEQQQIEMNAKKWADSQKRVALSMGQDAPGAAAIAAAPDYFTEWQIDKALSDKEGLAEMKGMLYPEYGDPYALAAMMVAFAAANSIALTAVELPSGETAYLWPTVGNDTSIAGLHQTTRTMMYDQYMAYRAANDAANMEWFMKGVFGGTTGPIP